MSNYCPTCGEATTGLRFCPQCGTRLEIQDATVETTETPSVIPAQRVAADDGARTVATASVPFLVDRGRALFGVIAPQAYLASAVQALLAYAATWIVGLVVAALALIGLSAVPVDWSWLFEAPGQLIGLSLGGVLTASTAIIGVSARVSLMWLPLLFTAATIVGIVILSRREERTSPAPSRGARWVLSGVVGLVLAIVSVLLAAIIPVVVTIGDSGGIFGTALSPRATISAASVTLFFGALILGAVVSYLSRARVAARRIHSDDRAVGELRGVIGSTLPVVVLYAAMAAAIFALIIIVLEAIGSASSLFSAPLWLPTAAVASVSFINLSPITLGGSALSLLGAGGIPSSAWMPAVLPAWATVLVLVVNLLLIVAIGAVLALRRASITPKRSTTWTTTIVSFGIAGAILSLIGSVAAWTHLDTASLGGTVDGILGSNSTTSRLSGLGSAGSAALDAYGSLRLIVGPAGWTFIVFAILGALVEVSATYLAPRLLQIAPVTVVDGAVRLLARVGIGTASPASSDIDADADADAGDGMALAAAPMTPERKRRLRRILGWTGGGLLVVVLAIVAVSIVNNTVFSPKRQVEDYLNSVVAKHASQAVRLGDIAAPNSSRSLLTDAVLRATPSGLSGYSIVSSTTSGDQSVVVAELVQGGSKSTTTYTVNRTGRNWLFFDSWKMSATTLPTLAVQLSPGVGSVKINGTTVTVSAKAEAAGVLQLPAFPGEYTVALGGDSRWLDAKSQSVVVHAAQGEDAASVRLTLAPTQAFKDALTKQIQTFLNGCAAQTTLTPKGCPFEEFGIGTITEVHWVINSVPKLSLTPSDDGAWTVTSTQEGTVSVSYDEDFFGVTPESDSSDFDVAGTVSLATGQPVFSAESEF